MGESCEYENLNTEVKDQIIMSCKSTKMREKILLEQDLTLAKLVDICRNMKSVKIQAKEMDDGNKESVSSNRKSPKKFGKRSLVKLQNTEKSCYKCGEKYQKRHNDKCKAIGKTCYNCGKTNHLSNVCRSKRKQASKIKKAENLEAKISANGDDESDSVQEVFTFSLSRNYANEMPNQQISSIESEHVTKTKTCQPTENENVNSIQLKRESITINGMSVKFTIDTGNSIDIIDKNTFDRIQSKGRKIKLFETKKKLYPYASDQIEMLGYFESLIENETRCTTTKLYVIKDKDTGNILGINSAILLNLVKLKSNDKNKVNKIEKGNNTIGKLLEDYNDVFNGTGKLKNHEAKLYSK